MNIVKDNPPNYDKINAKFGPLPATVLFAYLPYIYNPSGNFIPPEKIAHEQVHHEQQKDVGVEWWWEMYIGSKDFRLQEEIPAHQVDYKTYCQYVKDRNLQNDYLEFLAGQLSGPMYGGIIKRSEAKKIIKYGTKRE